MATQGSSARVLITLVICAALFVRILVGYQPHSGQDNHHGSKVAYGGDYEAQRHWLELTWNLPIGDWYWYDLQYWGLDYPPLTAYVSYLCGGLSERLIGPETVALYSSRGYENDPTHKAFMRATVWFFDAMIYFPAAFFILKVLWQSASQEANITRNDNKSRAQKIDYNFAITYLLALLQPSIILIDHGHFQYNTIALGLALWSVFFMTHPMFYMSCIWGSVFFCLALNFKQMTLYYAPVIFAYLLGRCFAPTFNHSTQSGNVALQNFLALGVTVIVSFGILWWPFLLYGHSDEENNNMLGLMLHRGKHVLCRIFPLERGLFEGKVSNLWCALDTKPVNIRDRIPQSLQPAAALVSTFLLMLPSCIRLFLVGKAAHRESLESQSKRQLLQHHASDLKALIWGTTSCALAFFLASFQVHEKSILLVLAPASLLAWVDTWFCDWFAIVAAWTMWPLLVVDRLQLAYLCTMVIFMVGVSLLRSVNHDEVDTMQRSIWESSWIFLSKLSVLAMFGLHVLENVIPIPSHLPDLFPVLWSVVGCALCCLAWLRTIMALFQPICMMTLEQKTKHE